MPAKQRARLVALTTLLQRQFPGIADPDEAIARGEVLVNGAPILNPRALVPADGAVHVAGERPLRGTTKLSHALKVLGLDVAGAVALDLGAAAGGFTQALLDAGAARVYAVDVGVGQLRGRLRVDPRVVNLERTNLADLDARLIRDPIGLVTMDLSYLSVADALPQLEGVPIGPEAQLIALVKPTFELHRAALAASPSELDEATAIVTEALSRWRWEHLKTVPSPIRGSLGALEAFVWARREPGGGA
jgi:23S rRNA (cytidine1920-2'-O)/16S rRNA (cytidine1409-2'-O)-methyltransferase